MIPRICARLFIFAGIAAVAQVQAVAQATMDGANPQFGTEPAPYATPAVPETAPRRSRNDLVVIVVSIVVLVSLLVMAIVLRKH